MREVDLEDCQNVDYIFCLRYRYFSYFDDFLQPLEVTDTTISCNLEQRQRSSQQILDLADYLLMHSSYIPIRRWDSPKSFSSGIPLWFELYNCFQFIDYFKDKFETDDVMLIHYFPSNLNYIEEFCREQKWRCASYFDITGSEASVTILYDLGDFSYEFFTRAKTRLVIVTIDEKQRYFF